MSLPLKMFVLLSKSSPHTALGSNPSYEHSDKSIAPNWEILVDIHKCGDCKKEFDSYESFLIHKLLVEQYKLILETSQRIPTLRLPKFIKINQTLRPNCEKEIQTNKSSAENHEIKESKDKLESSCVTSPISETVFSPIVEVVVNAEHSEDAVSDDGISVGSQPESLKIDEGAEGKDTSSPYVWEETLYRKMKETAEEERRIAVEKGNFQNGVPYITVIGDGGWAKRSYGHGMNSTGGVSESTSELKNGQKKDYYCKHCNRYYKNKVILRVHEQTVHSSIKPHVCTSCRQAFKTKGSLVRHIRTHTGERPFSCSQCWKAFLDSGALVRHVHRVHRKRPFKQARDVKVFITRLESATQCDNREDTEIS